MPHSTHHNARGAVAMLVAVGSLALMDACLKGLAPHYPAMQVTALRGMATLPIVLAWAAIDGGLAQLLRVRLSLHLLRAALGITALATFAYGLRRLPLSQAYSIFFVAPILITLFAAPLLGERVGRQRWLAVAAGFAGTLVVLRPTGAGALTLPGLAVLVCATCYALSAITVRILGRTDSTQSMVVWLMALISIGGTLLALRSWVPIQSGHWLLIAALGVTGSLGQWAITEAFRLGEASFIAPLEYTALVWGVGLDWFVWRTLPVPVTYVGAVIIIASGVFLVRRERPHAEAERP